MSADTDTKDLSEVTHLDNAVGAKGAADVNEVEMNHRKGELPVYRPVLTGRARNAPRDGQGSRQVRRRAHGHSYP
jgi:hypothetical protein